MSKIDIKTLAAEIESLTNEREIYNAKNIFNNKYLKPLYQGLKTMSVEEKKDFGIKMNKIKAEIDALVENRVNQVIALNDQFKDDNFIDKTIVASHFRNGRTHLLNQVANDLINFFERLDFDVIVGDELTTTKLNFDKLNIDQNHPARDMHDSFFLSENKLLRTHCTTSTGVFTSNNKAPIKIVSCGNVYRRDDDDATHSHQFMQLDFIWIQEDLTVANLKWLIDELVKHTFGSKAKTRYRLSYFPFTEPSFEVDVQCWNCKGKGCAICKKSGWIEVLGAGILHENVLKENGINSKKYRGIAAGIGIDRFAMLKHNIEDIRLLYTNDIEFNKQF